MNSPEANFCSSCGGVMRPADDTTLTFVPTEVSAQHGPETDTDMRLSIEEVPRGTGILVVKRGPNAGSRFVLEADVTRAGRHPESDIFLDDITVSRRHAEFVAQGRDFVVRDVGSLNGTYLNRERIEQAQLTSGDEVQIGKFKLVFISGPPRE